MTIQQTKGWIEVVINLAFLTDMIHVTKTYAGERIRAEMLTRLDPIGVQSLAFCCHGFQLTL